MKCCSVVHLIDYNYKYSSREMGWVLDEIRDLRDGN